MKPKTSRRDFLGSGFVSGVGGGFTIANLRQPSPEEMTAVLSTIKAKPSTLTTAQLRSLKLDAIEENKYARIQIRDHVYRLTYVRELGRTRLTVIWQGTLSYDYRITDPAQGR